MGANDRIRLGIIGSGSRGMQVLAVAGGGTLDQHLPEVVGHNGHSPAVDGYGTHGVALAEGSWLRTVLGARIDVPTHHHQGVRSHPGLVATGWADDGVVEDTGWKRREACRACRCTWTRRP